MSEGSSGHDDKHRSMVHCFFPSFPLLPPPAASRIQIVSQQLLGRIHHHQVQCAEASTLWWTSTHLAELKCVYDSFGGGIWIFVFLNWASSSHNQVLQEEHRPFTCWQRGWKACWSDCRAIMSISRKTCYDCKMPSCFPTLKTQNEVRSSRRFFPLTLTLWSELKVRWKHIRRRTEVEERSSHLSSLLDIRPHKTELNIVIGYGNF